MFANSLLLRLSLAALCGVVLMSAGCAHDLARELYEPPLIPPLGALSDAIWQNQEANAEASEFVVYQHEFEYNTPYLNLAGEDHVKQIASRVLAGQNLPVLVERSMTTAYDSTEFHYPVHPNPQLDMQRRQVIVRSLAMMGIHDADQRVVVAPALAPGLEATEAENAYYRGIFSNGAFGGGGGFGAFGTFGVFGGGIGGVGGFGGLF